MYKYERSGDSFLTFHNFCFDSGKPNILDSDVKLHCFSNCDIEEFLAPGALMLIYKNESTQYPFPNFRERFEMDDG